MHVRLMCNSLLKVSLDQGNASWPRRLLQAHLLQYHILSVHGNDAVPRVVSYEPVFTVSALILFAFFLQRQQVHILLAPSQKPRRQGMEVANGSAGTRKPSSSRPC